MSTKMTLLAFIIAASTFNASAHVNLPDTLEYSYESPGQSMPKLFEQAPFPKNCSVDFQARPDAFSRQYDFGGRHRQFAQGACEVPLPNVAPFGDLAMRDVSWY